MRASVQSNRHHEFGNAMPRPGCSSDVGMFAVQGEAATTQAQLRVPGAIDDGLGKRFMAHLDDAADLGRIAIRPGRPADQELARIAIAGLVMPPSRRVPLELCWRWASCRARPSAGGAGALKAPEVADLGEDPQRGGELHPPRSTCNTG